MKQDEKDRALLRLLVENGRLTNRELARRLGLSPSACLARVRRLESAGVIVGYRAIVARRGAGSRIEGWASVRLVDATRDATERFLQLVGATPEIVEAHRVAGDHDYSIRICTGDLGAWNDFCRNAGALGCEMRTRLSLLVETLK
jgi:DNA-binding Lrp family transcriptional regulator